MATNFLIKCVSCHKYDFHMASISVNTLWLLPWCRQDNVQIHCTIYSILCFAMQTCDIWTYLAVLHGNSFLIWGQCMSCHITGCSVDVFNNFSIWQLIFCMRTECELPHYMFVQPKICAFLSYYLVLTWQLQHFVSSALWSVHFSNEANVFSCHFSCWTIIGGVGVPMILPSLFVTFQLEPCGKYILLGGNCFIHKFISPWHLICSYLSTMARGDHQDDDDDFMELPQQNRTTGRTKDGDEVTFPPPICFECHI